MSKLFDFSSLAMVPSAYKDGKLYSVRPTDGSGDFTFSRGSNLAATRVDVNGLIEKGRENLLLRSNQFDTIWSENYLVRTSGQAGYDGSNNAWKLQGFSGTAEKRIRQSTSTTGIVTLSVYAKAGTIDFLWLRGVTSSTNVRTFFDLSNGTIGSDAAVASKITSVGNGWYRCEATFNQQAGFEHYIGISDADGSAVTSTTGYIFIQDAQLESSMVATDYIETGASTAQAGILEDMPRLDYSGGASCPSLLLEPQRSNLVPFSEHLESSDWSKTRCTIEDNSTTSPEGVVNASKMTSTDASESYIQDNLTTTGTKVTWSFFAKKGDLDYAHGLVWDLSANGCRQWFNLSTGAVGGTTTFGSGYSVDSATIEDYGNGWYRCAMVVNATAGTQGCRVNISSADTAIGSAVNSYGYFYGIQLEDASYPTSYIPTYGSSVTRSSDALETSPYDYQSQGVLGANVGTIILDCETIGTSTGSNDFHMFGEVKSIADGYLFRANTGTTIDILERDSNSTSAQWTGIAVKQTRNKIGVSYSGSDVDVYVNGVAKSVSSGTPVGGGNINGFANSTSNSAGLIIHQILLFPNKLTDSEMASITTL